MNLADKIPRLRMLLCLATILLPFQAVAQNPVNVTIDAAQTGAPISKYLYGQFLEHAGNLVQDGIWAEMVEDRKFYNPVTAKPAEAPAAPATGRRRGAVRRWVPVGGDDAVTLDPKNALTGDHSPLVQVSGAGERGVSQSGLGVVKEKTYTGHIWLAGSAGAVVKVTLAWGAEPTQQETVAIHGLGTSYKKFPLQFRPKDASVDARLSITGTGTGSFHIGTVSLMPSDNIEGFRAEVVNTLKQLHSGVYRFPGGNFVSSYEWRDGVGDRDKRPPIYDNVWRYAQSNDVGTDEFLTLCRLLGADPYITVNAGFGDAWSARELVEYTNGAVTTPMGKWRAANGHPQPYHVNLWGIGNEPWGDYQMGAMSLPQYEIKHNMFAREMRKVDPSITLIAGGAMPDVMEGADQAKRINGQYVPDYLSKADWSGNLLQHDLDNIDMLSEHFYASGTQHTDMKLQKKVPISPPLSLVEWEREPATQIRAKYEHYEQYLKLIPALQVKPVSIALDEWAYTGGSGYKVVPAYAWGFHEMFRHSDVYKLAAFTFATSMMSFNRTEAELNPTGLMFKMYRDHFGTIPVTVGGDSPQPKPTFPAGGDQPAVNPGSPTYPLDVSAAYSDDRKTMTFAVINPSETEQSMNLAIQGAKLQGQGHLWRMAPKSLDATNLVGQAPQVEVQEQTPGPVSGSIALPPYSISIYSYSVQ